MASPLLVVFLLQVVLVLINTFGAQLINDFLYYLYLQVTFSPLLVFQKHNAKLRKDILKLKNEMNATSAQDDFAKWAKLRRQYDKLQGDYDKKTATQTSQRTTFDSRASIARFLLVNGARFFINWRLSRDPMFWLPQGWLPWPAEWILSFPKAPMGSVSVQVWQMACGSVLVLVVEGVRASAALVMGSVQGTGGDREKVAVPMASSSSSSSAAAGRGEGKTGVRADVQTRREEEEKKEK